MDITSAEHLATELMTEHGVMFDGWSFAFDRASKRMGSANFTSRTITLSRLYAQEATEAQVEETILHEIAHVLAGRAAEHGPSWKAQARRLGATPAACGANPYAEKVRQRKIEAALACTRDVTTVKPAGYQPGDRVRVSGRIMVVFDRLVKNYLLVEPADGHVWRAQARSIRPLCAEDAVSPPSTHAPTDMPLDAGDEATVVMGRFAGSRFTVSRRNTKTCTGVMAHDGRAYRVPHHMLRRAA